MKESLKTLINTFYKCILSRYALEKVEDNSNFKGIKIKIGGINRTVNLIEDSEDEIAEDVKSMFIIFTIAAFEIIKTSEKFVLLKNDTRVLLLMHIRNAVLNNNIFRLNKSILPDTVIWRNKKLTTRRNGKNCFFNFIKFGEMFILFEDILKLLHYSDNQKEGS